MGVETDYNYQSIITSDVYTHIQGLLNRVISPEKRTAAYNTVSSFSHEQPLIASFLFVQLLLCFVPIAIFTSFVFGVVVFTAIVAVSFALFCVGVALLVLIPVLFIAVSLAIGTWLWAVATFLVSRWIYNLLSLGMGGTTEIAIPNTKKIIVSKSVDGYADVKVHDVST